ncbi:response regulator transcription factor [Arcobacter arenosus]|uniref:Response regulator transcription factor n=1 Tax=Arcobacter arenosus TaxID=2576037 RepID=A0A5R8Y2W4_9BACT|nr:response regulator transcription factor [Arcobacter arenosus]TLP39210.1 response regulator transcription factor [Arcobacter arenosus]
MNNLTILYAEDEIETRKNYGNYLKRNFKEVYIAQNGEEALKYYEKFEPNIMLLDINMPFINGLELTKKIRENDKKTRIIILTAHLEQDKLLFAAELNLTKYLPKPISRMKLKEALNEAVNQYKELNDESSNFELKEGYIFNKDSNKLIYKDTEIKLTKHESQFLVLLTSNKNRIFTSDEIYNYLWDEVDICESSATKLKDLIKRLRKKLPKDSIENIYGAGYKLNIKEKK